MKIIVNKYEPQYVIKFIRQATGLTQREFGNRIGKSRNTIQSYELGRIKMSFNDFINVCKIFNITVTIEEVKNGLYVHNK